MDSPHPSEKKEYLTDSFVMFASAEPSVHSASRNAFRYTSPVNLASSPF